MELRKVHIQVPAKINVSLTVEPPRADGMHPITSRMTKIALYDDLEVTRLDDHALSRYAILWHAEATRRTEIDWAVTNDLAVRAHRLLEKTVGQSLPIQMKLEKRIPVGSGLGGGSSDAAAMLQAITQLFQLDVEVEETAIQLGSDVPFFLTGGAALVSGIGETVKPIAYEEQYFVLVIPEYCCQTAEVYAAFDTLGCSQNADSANDLAFAACKVVPQLAIDMEELHKLSGQKVHLSGSGSSMFIICDNAHHAITLAEIIEKQSALVALATQTHFPQIELERI